MIVGHRVQMRRETSTDTGIDPPKLAPSEAFDMRPEGSLDGLARPWMGMTGACLAQQADRRDLRRAPAAPPRAEPAPGHTRSTRL
jgi:hypothetical protein